MKILYLRHKDKPKRKLQNVHFGKMVLTLMLVSVMVLGSIEPAKAGGDYAHVWIKSNIKQSEVDYLYCDHINVDYGKYLGGGTFPSYIQGYEGYKINSNGNFEFTGDIISVNKNRLDKSVWDYATNWGSWDVYSQCYEERGAYRDLALVQRFYVIKKSQGYIKDTEIGSVVDLDRYKYPDNGIKDGYWYEYIGERPVNNNPILDITTPTQNEYFGKDDVIKLSGKVTDPDFKQKVTISATINGKTKSKTFSAPLDDKSWELTWSSKDLKEGKYSNIIVTARDSAGGSTNKTYKGNIIVDKTASSSPEITLNNNNWTNQNVTVTIDHGSELGSYQSGVKKSQYRINNGSWIDYTQPFTVKNEGITTIYARTIDKVGNISEETSKEIKIDKTAPLVTLTGDITKLTNKDVTIIAQADDDLSGIKEIFLPDGTSISDNEVTFVVTENGSYIFKVVDKAGNEVEETIEIKNIDKVPPVITIEPYVTEWTNKDIVVTAKTDKGTLNQESYTFSENGSFTFIAIDEAGNRSEKEVIITNIDKTPPITPEPIITIDSTNEITVEALPTDDLAGLHEEYIMWNKDGADLESWTAENRLVDSKLIPNAKYTYKYKARDKVENISGYSEPISKYTLASYPVKVKLEDYTSNTVAFTIFNDKDNENVPENQIILKEKGTDKVVAISEWTKEEMIILENLVGDKNYEVWLNTRNEDDTENGEIKLCSTSEPPLVDYKDESIDDFITYEQEAYPIITIKPYNTELTNQDITVYAETNKGTLNQESYTFVENGNFTFISTTLLGNKTEKEVMITNIDKIPPVITIDPYEMEPTNEDITVHATVDKGKLNQDSYTFTENGNFTFIATDEAGNRSEKTVTITNIDKTLPTEGEITIIAVDEERRTIKTIHKKNLGLGVQVVTALDIPGCKLISTPVVTIWLKPADNVKKVTFTYKLDMDWEGWKEAGKAVEEAEKKVKGAEEHPTKGNKAEAQKRIDKAKDIVEKLPGSKKKDELNKKLDDLQKRLDKVIIPKEDLSIRDRFDNDDNKKDVDKPKIDKPELENISSDEFVARWKGHEVLSQEPILIEEISKARFEIKDKANIMNEKELSPRLYQWNEKKEKWVALATKIDKDKIETYKDITGYVAAFAVKQPTFSDVKGNEWYAEPTDRANGLAMIEGYTLKDGNTVLKPYDNISRSELYTIVGRLFGAVPEGQTSLYDEFDYIIEDKGSNWYVPYLEEFKDKKIIDEVFDKEQAREEVTRLEVVEVLTRMLEEVEKVDYVDLDKFKDTEKLKGIKIAKIIDGYEDETLRLDDKITRAEALKLIINTLEKLGW